MSYSNFVAAPAEVERGKKDGKNDKCFCSSREMDRGTDDLEFCSPTYYTIMLLITVYVFCTYSILTFIDILIH